MGKPVHVVFGASGGIGSATVRELAAAGCEVVLAARGRARLDALARSSGGTAVELDARDATAVSEALEDVSSRHGRVDGVAHCVGSLLLKPAHLTTPEEWAETIEVNLGTAFNVVRAAGRSMREGGSVVLVSSAAARHGFANHEAIAAAKAGVIGLALSAAASYAARGLRFNAVAPGLVRTPMTSRITGRAGAEKSSTDLHALGRLGEPEDVAGMIAWLLDPRQTWVTGQVFGVDGGLATVRSRRA
ncbi:MAG: SDR family oxidoreductase [Acidobacteria bacterium]|nr:SDR family oxidoreductase [Acidobacteriota bacterium]NIM61769.1 SDR family oxidoreductase [Acidobacteriota bacterium]NIO60013.1 SDR family oxidoreductase [Acidobacteriota bacterium]NIQ29205.1 SDR family oxidoreductase [Acidobacteriota bacterium]NIQ83779.1 SDR family oxidoreductase [Acidobacteriota bacterium]